MNEHEEQIHNSQNRLKQMRNMKGVQPKMFLAKNLFFPKKNRGMAKNKSSMDISKMSGGYFAKKNGPRFMTFEGDNRDSKYGLLNESKQPVKSHNQHRKCKSIRNGNSSSRPEKREKRIRNKIFDCSP